MTVKCFRDFLVLALVVKFSAEFEALLSGMVVEVEHLGVLSECVEDDLANFNEEVDTGHDARLLLHLWVLAVGHEDQVLGV